MAERIIGGQQGAIGLPQTPDIGAAELEHLNKGVVQNPIPAAAAPLATQNQLKAAGSGMRALDSGRLESPTKSFMSTMATRHHVGRILQKLPQTEDNFGKLEPMVKILKSYHAWTNDIVRVLGRV